jgi:hypothetical protein
MGFMDRTIRHDERANCTNSLAEDELSRSKDCIVELEEEPKSLGTL